MVFAIYQIRRLPAEGLVVISILVCLLLPLLLLERLEEVAGHRPRGEEACQEVEGPLETQLLLGVVEDGREDELTQT